MYLGIDIGGTAVKWGILDNCYSVVEKSSFPTDKSSDTALLSSISELIIRKKQQYELDGVGIGAPGYVDDITGIIAGSDNTPFKNTSARMIIEKASGVRVRLGNDANCAALGEYTFCREKADNIVLITLGTGVGGGIILNRKLYIGSSGFAGEIGHMVIVHDGIKCSCGRRGCLEQYASATALIRMTREEVEKNNGYFDGEKISPESIDGKTVFEFEARGSSMASEILDKYASYLAAGIVNLSLILSPDEIVLAGGITNEKDVLLAHVSKYLPENCKIRISELKNDAGFIGAAMLNVMC